MQRLKSIRLSDRALLALWVGLAVFAFGPVASAFFVSDDFFLVKGVLERGPFGILTFGERFFRPASALSLWLDAQLWGLRSVGYHLTNILLHAVASFAVVKIGERLGLERRLAIFAGLLFLLAPSHSEPVAWISCRMDLLATATGLIAAWLWLGATGQPGRRVVAGALLAIALLAKESAAAICLVLAAREGALFVASRDPAARRRAVVGGGMIVVILLTYVVVRRVAIGEWIGGYAVLHEPIGTGQVLLNLAVFTFRAISGPIPAELIPLDRPLYGVFDAAAAYVRMHPGYLVLALAVAAAGGLLAVRAVRRVDLRPAWPFFVAYLLALLPVVKLSVSLVTVEGERFLYLPSVALILGASVVGHRVLRGVRLRRIVSVAVLVVSTLALEHSLLAWRSAGKLAAALLPQIAEAARSEPAMLLNLPDNLRGAYVFRNGLPEALALYHPGVNAVHVTATHSVLSELEQVTVECTAQGPALHLGDSRSWFFTEAPPPGIRVAKSAVGANNLALVGQLPLRFWIVSGVSLVPSRCP